MNEIWKSCVHTRVWSISIHEDKIALGCGDGLIRLGAMSDGQIKWERVLSPDGSSLCLTDPLLPTYEPIRVVAFSPDGSLLATGCFDHVTRLYDTRDYREVSEISAHKSEVKCVSFSPDGKRLATCGRDRTVWIFDVSNARDTQPDMLSQSRSVLMLHDHMQDVKSVSFGGDATHLRLASGGYDNTLFLYEMIGDEAELLSACRHPDMDVQTAEDTPAYKRAHTHTIWGVRVLPDGDVLSCCADGSVRLWTMLTLEEIGDGLISSPSGPNCSRLVHEYVHPAGALCIDWLDGYCAVGCEDGAVLLLDGTLSLLASVRAHEAPVNAVALFRGKDALGVVSADDLGCVLFHTFAGSK